MKASTTLLKHSVMTCYSKLQGCSTLSFFNDLYRGEPWPRPDYRRFLRQDAALFCAGLGGGPTHQVRQATRHEDTPLLILMQASRSPHTFEIDLPQAAMGRLGTK